jgi:hypothetical protein
MSEDYDLAVSSCCYCGEYVVEGADNARETDEGLAHTWCDDKYSEEAKADAFVWAQEDAAIEAAREKEENNG